MDVPSVRVGLVELHLDLSNVRRQDRDTFECVREGVERDSSRAVRVVEALKAARSAGCELVVFPGWTVVGSAVPKQILDLSDGITVVCEVLSPGVRSKAKTAADGGFPWTTFVVRDQQVILSARQRVAQASDLPGSADDLVHDLRGSRRFDLRADLEALLLVCGEVNIVKGSKRSADFLLAVGTEADVTADVLVNPAHTPTKLPAMNDKREWLGRTALVTTANTFEGLQGGKFTRQYRKASAAWVRGTELPLAEVKRDEGWKLMSVETGRRAGWRGPGR